MTTYIDYSKFEEKAFLIKKADKKDVLAYFLAITATLTITGGVYFFIG